MRRCMTFIVALLAGSAMAAGAAQAQETPERFAPCVQGMADRFPCKGVDMLYHFPVDEIGGGRGSDVWGWEDPRTGREYVIAGRETGTSFIDITDPKRPVYLGNLPSASAQVVIWRDIKVYRDHAYIVSEATGHGMQVFDLRQLRDVDPEAAPVTFQATARYTRFGRAHNLAINEETGFAYAVHSVEGEITCNRGIHMMDIRDPSHPRFVGCFEESGPVHDTQCVVYRGPDRRFHGREICVNSSPGPSKLSIADVTNKRRPLMLSSMGYPGSAYSHQGWLTEDQAQFLHGDELDELGSGHTTRTMIWDLRYLTDPRLRGQYFATTPATDHNMYVKRRYLYQSNYRAGLRILDLRNVAAGQLEEVGFFDVYPENDDPGFSFGTWSNYPFFKSGVVAVHGYQGLWLLKPRGDA